MGTEGLRVNPLEQGSCALFCRHRKGQPLSLRNDTLFLLPLVGTAQSCFSRSFIFSCFLLCLTDTSNEWFCFLCSSEQFFGEWVERD